MIEQINSAQGNYQILKKLGSGSSGEVYLVTRDDLESPVALKLMRQEQLSPEHTAAFKQEFFTLTQLHNPHICEVYEFGQCSAPAGYYFTSEYIDGQPLYECELTPAQLESVFIQSLTALQALAAYAIIHRDIKGSNILAHTDAHEPQVSLIDFGFATKRDQQQLTTAGTLQYMAPELFTPQTPPDHRSDLYALAICMYRAYTGEYPSKAKTVHELRQWHHHAHIDPNDLTQHGATPHVAQCIVKLLQNTPSKRYSSANAALRFLALHSPSAEIALSTAQPTRIGAGGPFVGRDAMLESITNSIRRSRSEPSTPAFFVIRGNERSGKTSTLRELQLRTQLLDVSTEWHDLADDDCAPPQLTTHTHARCIVLDNVHAATGQWKRWIAAVDAQLLQCALRDHVSPLVIIAALQQDAALRISCANEQHILKPLSQRDVRQYFSELAASSDHTDWAELAYDFSGGNPDLMRVAAQELYTHGTITNTSHDALFAQRVQSLDCDALALLRVIAHVPQGIPLVHVHTLDIAALTDHLFTLTQHELITKTHTRYSIQHGALRDYLQQHALSESERALFSQLVEHAKACAANTQTIAHYAQHSLTPETSTPYLEELSNAAEQHGNLEKARHYTATQMELTTDTTQRLGLQRRLGRLTLLAGNIEDARSIFTKLTNDTDAHDLVGQTNNYLELGWIARVTRQPKAEAAYFDQALALQAHPPESLEHLRILNERAQAHFELNELSDARQLFESTARLSQQLAEAEQQALHNNNLGMVLAKMGDTKGALQWYTDKIEQFAERPRIATSARIQRAQIYAAQHLYRDALQDFRDAWRHVERDSSQRSAGMIVNNLISLCQTQALYAEALTYAQHGLTLANTHQQPTLSAQILITTAQLYTAMHCHHLAERYLDAASEHIDDTNTELQSWHQLATLALADDRDDDTAEQWIERIMNNAETSASVQQWAQYIAANRAHRTDNTDRAHTLLNTVPLNISDRELQLRTEVLRSDIALHNQDTHDTNKLQSLLHTAQQHDMRELVWEIEFILGKHASRRQQHHEAEIYYQRAFTGQRNIAADLDEAHRENYCTHRNYTQVHEALQRTEPQVDGDLTMQTLEHVLRITKMMACEHEPQRLLNIILDEAIAMSGAERGLILTPAADEFTISLARNIDTNDITATRYSQSIARQVAASGKPLITIDVPDEEGLDLTSSIVSLRLQSVACLPLLFKGKLQGLIYLDSQTRSHPLTQELTTALEYFAEQAAIALANAEKLNAATQARVSAEAAQQEAAEQLQTLHEALDTRETRYSYDNIIGQSKAIHDVLRTLDKITATNATVHICGETGTGKELIAKALHFNHPERKQHRFVAINCAALPENILESELFGYRKGAFTGAERDKPGLLEEAHGGTVFLDEISDMPATMQAKLLRCIQEQEVLRLGDQQARSIDVRFLAASNRSLEQLVADGQFRQDLYYRLAGLTIALPALRERKEDITLLAQHFTQAAITQHKLPKSRKMSAAALRTLQQHSWPGNVRELEHTITNSLLLAETNTLEPHDIIFTESRSVMTHHTQSISDHYDPALTLKDYECRVIEQALRHFDGNKSKTATALGITRVTLTNKIKQYNLA